MRYLFTMTQNELRKKVKVLKALYNVSYKDIASKLQIHKNSMYNWLKGYFTLSTEKERQLIEIIKQFETETR